MYGSAEVGLTIPHLLLKSGLKQHFHGLMLWSLLSLVRALRCYPFLPTQRYYRGDQLGSSHASYQRPLGYLRQASEFKQQLRPHAARHLGKQSAIAAPKQEPGRPLTQGSPLSLHHLQCLPPTLGNPFAHACCLTYDPTFHDVLVSLWLLSS